jgi:peptidoglycan/xylan/chitin deacetylase (PgdA/CDA1 family)/dTDP-4-dehydrorhamnose 3,5-epimerase-like enzyme
MNLKKIFAIILILLTTVSVWYVVPIEAQNNSPSESFVTIRSRPKPSSWYPPPTSAKSLISFRFDDGVEEHFTVAAPKLGEYGYNGSAYVTTSWTQVEGYLNWTQIDELSEVYNWEIGSHQVNEVAITSLSESELEHEIWDSKTYIEGNTSASVYTFCPVGMNWNSTTDKYVVEEYIGQTTSTAINFNAFPWNPYSIYVKAVKNDTSLNTVKGYIDTLIEQTVGEYMVLMFHEIKPDVGGIEWGTTPTIFEGIVDYVYERRSNLQVLTVKEAVEYIQYFTSLVPNPDMDEGSGTWVYNWSRSLAGYPDANAVWDANLALNFDGHDDYVEITDDASLKPQQLTFLTWIYITGEDDMRHIIRHQRGGSFDRAYQMWISSINVLSFCITNSTHTDLVSASAPSNNTWHHIVGTASNTELKLYIDNSLVDNTTRTIGDISYKVQNPYIGGFNPPAYNVSFEGMIDEFRMYNRTLDSTEISEHYEGTFSNETGLVLYLDFNGRTTDQSGEGNDGTNFGAIFVEGHVFSFLENHGFYPSSCTSIKYMSNYTSDTHLMSEYASVTYGYDYYLYFYVEMKNFTEGQLSVICREYDSEDTYLGAIFIIGFNDSFTGLYGYKYTPTSIEVVKWKLNFFDSTNGDAGANFTTYIDHVLFFRYGPIIESFLIENIDIPFDGGDYINWIFSEEKYYVFNLRVSCPNVMTMDTAMLYFLDGANHNISIYFDFSDNSSGILSGDDYISEDSASTELVLTETIDGIIYRNVTWYILLRINIVDRLDTDFYGYLNTTSGAETGWILANNDYAQIYNRGGLAWDWTTGNSGRMSGGDIFELYVYNNSLAGTTINYRYLQHFKIVFSMSFVGNLPVKSFVFNLNGWDNIDGWKEIISVTIDPYCLDIIDDRWINYSVTWEVNDVIVKIDNVFFYLEGITQNMTVTHFLDLWFNRVNASSVVGGRFNAYYYPMTDNSNPWLRWWTGNNWGIDEDKRKQSMCFGTMTHEDNSTKFTKELEMMSIDCAILHGIAPLDDGTYMFYLHDFDVYDLTFGSKIYEGIPTPIFEETRVPLMPAGGLLGWLGGVITENFRGIMGFLSPAFTSISGFFINAIDSSIEGITGRSGVFSSWLATIGTLVGYFLTMLGHIPTALGNMMTVFGNVLTWFFGGVTTFFTDIWNTLSFITSPALGMFQTIADSFGVARAWLAGTTYTNGAGQVFNFEYLSGFNVLGVTGGAAIFALLIVVGTPIVMVVSFFEAMRQGSFEPLIAPFNIVWRMLMFMIHLGTIVFNISKGVITMLMNAFRTVKDAIKWW